MIEKLREILGDKERASTAETILQQHSADESDHLGTLPDAVVFPKNTEEVSAIVKYANAAGIPIVGWGAGSSLEGNCIPVKGGIVVNFREMNQITELHEGDFQVTVQPGIFYKDMNKQLARHGLFFAPDPGANASIGGMIANNASGTRTVKYGATRDNVLALEVVLANGEIIQCGSRSVKQSAGYDLVHLFTGSEGTLGLITSATLKLEPIPSHFSAVLASFETTSEAADAVFGVIGSGVTPAAIELLDADTMTYLNREDGIDLPIKPHLLMEFHGATETILETELALVREICTECGGQSFDAGVGRDERDRLWHGRHRLGEILFGAHPDHTYLITDVSVPISAYPELASYTATQIKTNGFKGALFGHAGDGNLHTIVYAPKDAPDQHKMLAKFNDSVVSKAIELGGTCTGEHGIGIGKQKYMVHEHGEGAIELMKLIKSSLDPNNILNPGKVVSI